jgi:hypothetical protein
MVPVLVATASQISGELDLDWRFLLLDTAEVALSAVAADALVTWRRRRAPRRRAWRSA